MEKALDIDDKCEFAYETLGTMEVQRSDISLSFDMISKYHYSKCKIQNIGLDMEYFKRDVNMRLNVEHVIACMYCKQHKFFEKWILYKDLFDI